MEPNDKCPCGCNGFYKSNLNFLNPKPTSLVPLDKPVDINWGPIHTFEGDKLPPGHYTVRHLPSGSGGPYAWFELKYNCFENFKKYVSDNTVLNTTSDVVPTMLDPGYSYVPKEMIDRVGITNIKEMKNE